MTAETKADRFAGFAGWKDARRNKLTGDWTSVYLTEAQGIDGEEKYMVVCEEHGTNISVATLRDALFIAGDATEFCDDCRELQRRSQ